MRFTDMTLRASVWKKKTAFKGSPFSLAEFLTLKRQALFSEARKVFGMRSCWSQDGNIHVKLRNGKRERIESDDDIVRLKNSVEERRPQTTSTPEPSADVNAETEPSGQAGRSRRVTKPVTHF